MPTIFTCDNPGGGDVTKSYPDPSLRLCVNTGSDIFTEKRVDQIEVGDRICPIVGKPGPSLEVTAIQEV